MIDFATQNQTLAALNPQFKDQVNESDLKPIGMNTLQLNLGKWCNQTCRHCHVEAGPHRAEKMTWEIAEKCAELMKSDAIETVDLTGGAPEGHEVFKFLVTEAKKNNKRVIDRCNLTILTVEGFEWVAPFLKEHQVEVVSSLPHFSHLRTDQQRGKGVFDKSILGLKILNDLGYGKDLILNLVYNPSGLILSAPQNVLEREFKENLKAKFDIEFNQLFCINNMPISRFLESLLRANKLEKYHEILVNAYNPATLNGLMCRQQISVGYDGSLYDCDFNQMLDLKAKPIAHIDDFDVSKWLDRKIILGNHCFGCTAGSGSSCGGEIV